MNKVTPQLHVLSIPQRAKFLIESQLHGSQGAEDASAAPQRDRQLFDRDTTVAEQFSDLDRDETNNFVDGNKSPRSLSFAEVELALQEIKLRKS